MIPSGKTALEMGNISELNPNHHLSSNNTTYKRPSTFVVSLRFPSILLVDCWNFQFTSKWPEIRSAGCLAHIKALFQFNPGWVKSFILYLIVNFCKKDKGGLYSYGLNVSK